nr:hypothetical protein [uncultured Bacillus sp.]
MNRLDFFKEMKTGLLKTVTSIYEPIMEDDMEKINKVADQLLGIKWFYLTDNTYVSRKVEQKRINGRPCIISYDEGSIKAYSGICLSCSQLLYLSTADFTCKCLTCEKEIKLFEFEPCNHQIILEYPVKKQKDGYYVGLK